MNLGGIIVADIYPSVQWYLYILVRIPNRRFATWLLAHLPFGNKMLVISTIALSSSTPDENDYTIPESAQQSRLEAETRDLTVRQLAFLGARSCLGLL